MSISITTGILTVCCAGLELGPSCSGLSARLGRWSLILQNCTTTSVLAVVPAGAGSNLMLSLNVGGQTVSYFGRNFTYAPPVITSLASPGTVQPLLMPTTAILNDGTIAYVVIQGTGFGPAASTLTVSYGIAAAYDISIEVGLVSFHVLVCLQAEMVCSTRRQTALAR